MFPLKDNIPNERFPLITVALIIVNVIVYLLEIRHGGSFFGGPSSETVNHAAAIPYDFTHPGTYCEIHEATNPAGVQEAVSLCAPRPFPGQIPTWQTAFTAMFMHGGFLHIGGNMLFLWIFGPNVEEATGRLKYLVFYLLGGLLALAAQIAVGPNSMVPTLGASGAIAAVLGGYILLYPRARILSLIFIIFFVTIVEVPAVVLLGFWFLLNLVYGGSGLATPAGGSSGVAYFAHVGGFVFGLVLIRVFAGRRRSRPPSLQVS